ncbi:MAG: hypothetical protein M3304_10800 [Actinomycetota bacterium]|nr:hypothetical protein [Actinomycetota bacterium]
MSEPEDRGDARVEPVGRADEDEDAVDQAAEADETLPPASMPGGPEYPEEASEGPDTGAPAH